VEAAELCDQLVAGTEVQVVGVAEQDVRPEVAQLVGVKGLHGALRSDGHERGRRHLAVRGRQDPGPRRSVCRGDPKRPHSTSMASPNE
jgi:hypothetical protein